MLKINYQFIIKRYTTFNMLLRLFKNGDLYEKKE